MIIRSTCNATCVQMNLLHLSARPSHRACRKASGIPLVTIAANTSRETGSHERVTERLMSVSEREKD